MTYTTSEGVGEMERIGLALAASARDDSFVTALVHALAEPVVRAGMGLVAAVVRDDREEEELYRRWAGDSGLSAVVLLGVRRDDPRVPLLRSLGFTLAAVIDSAGPVDFPAVIVDFGASMAVLKDFLVSRQHSRTVYIASIDESTSSSSRAAAIATAELEDQLEVVRVAHTADAAIAAGFAALREGPATLVFDSDAAAVGAFSEARERGLDVPGDVAVVCWTNSVLCQSTASPITAVNRRGSEIGTLLGEQVLTAIAGDAPTLVRAPQPYVVVGGTT